jgi:hypothetical protein
MKKYIKVFIYSYKEKDLYDQILLLKNNESGTNKVVYYVYDQSNINREYIFKNIEGVVYNFVNWNDYSGISVYRKKVLSLDKSDFYMEVSSIKYIEPDWDVFLINSLKGEMIISGTGNVKINIDGYFIKKEVETSTELLLTNYADMSFIFMGENCFIFLNKLISLKGVGQDLLLSLILINNSYQIYSLPSKFCSTGSFDYKVYRPYSIYNGYNKLINFLRLYDTEMFKNVHGVDLKTISKMPYQVDDVEYNTAETNLSHLDEGRFLKPYSFISIV